MIWSAVRITRRRIAFSVLLGPVAAGLLIITRFGAASDDASDALTWLFPWGFLSAPDHTNTVDTLSSRR